MTPIKVDFDIPQMFEQIILDEDEITHHKIVRRGRVSLMFKDIVRIEDFLFPNNFPTVAEPKSVIYTHLGAMIVLIDFKNLLHLWTAYKTTLKGRLNSYYSSIN